MGGIGFDGGGGVQRNCKMWGVALPCPPTMGNPDTIKSLHDQLGKIPPPPKVCLNCHNILDVHTEGDIRGKFTLL